MKRSLKKIAGLEGGYLKISPVGVAVVNVNVNLNVELLM